MWKVKRLFRRKKPSPYSRTELQLKAIQHLEKKYDFLAFIGSGSFSDIIALWSKYEKITVAAKIIHPQMTSKGELKLWPKLKHHNIVPVLKIWRFPEVDVFLMPHYSKTLMTILEESSYRKSPKSFDMATEWMTDILCGLEYLHACNICHLDLKTDNIMITGQNTAAIGDFSSIESSKDLTDGYALPRYYCPPEAWPLEVDGPLPRVDGKAFDIWSYGMVLIYCFSNRWMEKHLWGQTNWWDEIFPLVRKCFEFNLYRHQMCQAFPCSHIDDATYAYSLNLLKGVLRYESKDRPTPSKILQHAVLCKNGKDLLQPDIIWTYRKEEVQKLLLKGKLDHMMKIAAHFVKMEKKRLNPSEDTRSSFSEFNNNDEIPSLKEYCCCCCEKQDDTDEE